MSRRSASTVQPAPVQSYKAGCQRTWLLACAAPELAYTELPFAECPDCPHRVAPEGGPEFCTLRPQGTAHPFAALAGFELS